MTSEKPSSEAEAQKESNDKPEGTPAAEAAGLAQPANVDTEGLISSARGTGKLAQKTNLRSQVTASYIITQCPHRETIGMTKFLITGPISSLKAETCQLFLIDLHCFCCLLVKKAGNIEAIIFAARIFKIMNYLVFHVAACDGLESLCQDGGKENMPNNANTTKKVAKRKSDGEAMLRVQGTHLRVVYTNLASH